MFRNIPTITKNLLLINIVVFLAVLVFQNQFDLTNWGKLYFFKAPDFQIYQLITYQFLHADVWHIFCNMFALWMFGCVIERVWGPQRFLIYYFVCGIGAGLCQEVVQYFEYTSSGLAELSLSELIPVDTGNGTTLMSVGAYLNSWGTIGASGVVYGIHLCLTLLLAGVVFHIVLTSRAVTCLPRIRLLIRLLFTL